MHVPDDIARTAYVHREGDVVKGHGTITMALDATLTRAGHSPQSIDTTAKVHLHRQDGGFPIPQIELTTVAVVAGLLDDEFAQLAQQAKESCPIGKVLHAVPTTLSASRKS
jgi:osmotically inducible protein OsmC